MRFLNCKKEYKIFFINEIHLAMLNAANLPIYEIGSIVKNNSISKVDSLNWLKYQRNAERNLLGSAFTTFDSQLDESVNETLFGHEYKQIIESDNKQDSVTPIKGKNYFYMEKDVVVILTTNNTMNSNMFRELCSVFPQSVLGALLQCFGYLKCFQGFNDTFNGRPLSPDQLTIGHLLMKCTL